MIRGAGSASVGCYLGSAGVLVPFPDPACGTRRVLSRVWEGICKTATKWWRDLLALPLPAGHSSVFTPHRNGNWWDRRPRSRSRPGTGKKERMIKRERENGKMRKREDKSQIWAEAKSDQIFRARLDSRQARRCAPELPRRCHLPDRPCEVRVFPPRRCQGRGWGRAPVDESADSVSNSEPMGHSSARPRPGST